MNEQTRVDWEPYYRSRSTLLIPESYFKRYFWRSPYIKVGHLALGAYLSILMDDPQLEYKLSCLERTGKWKKHYQEEGQDLCRVNFYPDDRDWGRLSAISNATGYSRCYIFVYLMLIAMGVISLDDGGTSPVWAKGHWNPEVFCSICVDAITRKLTRILQT
ncbi:MAG: DUF1564 family protein [Leptonema illini]|jgi:hypothetical protein|uniref:DUF1564 family protein n=1 Tax=Leptonema illini TaxID=183 RepID=A0A833H4X3_9LEPT|nr:MAG: DUF1564 family protein [Leptonema illini]PKL34818.1 MAG: hypothetical protein CVV45_01300 [Spirochaetae bacterium HGW-Spirochaetae-10]